MVTSGSVTVAKSSIARHATGNCKQGMCPWKQKTDRILFSLKEVDKLLTELYETKFLKSISLVCARIISSFKFSIK